MTVSEGGVSLRERQRQERERLIVRAAADLFAERGYHDTSMDDIAARVGIAKGTVYLHFASKEDLTLALLEQGVRDLTKSLDTILSADGTPRSKLEAVFGVYSAVTDGSFQLFSTIFRNPEVVARLHEKREVISALWDEPKARLTEILEEGKATGEFDPTMPTPIMLSLLMGLLAPHRWERPITGKQLPPGEVARHISRFFFKGIAPCEHAPPPAASTPAP